MQINANSINSQFSWMANSSSNIANINTSEYKAFDTTIDDDSNSIVANSSVSKQGTNLAKELTDQTLISTGVDANVKAINTQNDIVGTLLDMLA